MRPANTTWRITWGDYDFALDRQTLTYDLTETQTGTVWASGLSVGWMELENRATGERVQHDFAHAKLVSVAEKSSAQGKRLLLGLDLLGVPIDLYFICSQREIQLTVEASRDTREYLVQDVGLLPGLVSVPDDGESYLALPIGEGAAVYASKVTQEVTNLPVWDYFDGLSMPFVGAVRFGQAVSSALSFITDSAYTGFDLSKSNADTASLDSKFVRDPERRRLDVRLQVLPEAQHIAIAKTYRAKLIEDRNHVTLRRKIKDRPLVEKLLGCAYFQLDNHGRAPAIGLSKYFVEAMDAAENKNPIIFADFGFYGLDTIHTLRDASRRSSPAEDFHTVSNLGYLTALLDDVGNVPLDVGDRADEQIQKWIDFITALDEEKIDAVVLLELTSAGLTSQNNWDEVDARTQFLQKAIDRRLLIGTAHAGCDWAYSQIDFGVWYRPHTLRGTISCDLPMFSVIYRDCIASASFSENSFLSALLHLTVPAYWLVAHVALGEDYIINFAKEFQRQSVVFSPLHILTFTAFLTEHRFLQGFHVEEATYSDKTYVIVNQSETDAFERGDLHLPPLGFYVRHAQMEAHYALRVGEQTFETPAWRIRRARDGKRLEESEDVLVQEFPV